MAGFRLSGPLRELARVDLPQAVSEAAEISSEMARKSARHAVIEAAIEDGQLGAVVRQVTQLEATSVREDWIKDVFRRWGSLDTDAPMSALRSITDPALAQSAMTGLVTGWTELDPRGAFDYALDNRADPLVGKALGAVMSSAIHHSDASEVRSMFSALVEKGAYASVANEVGMQLAHQYPTMALEFAVSLTDERQRNRQTTTALSALARNDFHAAATYFEAMPADDTKAGAFSTMAHQALRQNSGAARVASWVNSFSGKDRTRVVQSLIGQQDNQPAPLKPADAAVIAQVIAATPGLNEETLERARKTFGTVSP